MKVALIGAGRIGRVHARSIRFDARSTLVGVADAVPDAAQALATDYGVPVVSLDDIFSDPSIDAILIASSTNTHADLIERGIEAGKAIFCEKPIDLSLDRALQVRMLAMDHARPIMMGFNRRFDPTFSALKASYDAGSVGTGTLLTVTSYDPAPPPASYIVVSGGLFRDMTIHDFDMCAFFFGMPEAVMAHGACLVDPEIGAQGDIDTAVIVLTYADGRLATIRNSRQAAYGYDQRIEILGTDGALSAENVVESTIVHGTRDGITSAKPVHFFLERYMRAYEIEWTAFVSACLEAAPVPASVQDGINALALAEAANQSLSTGGPVQITQDLTGQ